jgi:SAM-dependent methyltransferase
VSSPKPTDSVAGATRVIVDEELGYRRLDPLPSPSDVDRFYESRYRDLLDAGGRAPDLARLLGGGLEAERERAWLSATLYTDVLDALEGVAAAGATRRVLDVGCGTGDLLRFVSQAGWEAIGTEPASELAAAGRSAGLLIENTTAADYLTAWRTSGAAPFAGITLLNVLEHVPDPLGTLTGLIDALVPDGRLIVRVPNDFSALQETARSLLDRDPWWIAIPDHLNYFDHRSIAQLIERLGLEVIDQTGDFPMEMFLLMGDDYTSDPDVGRIAHERRRRIDLALDPALRRSLGRGYAAAGVGRNAFVVAARSRP